MEQILVWNVNAIVVNNHDIEKTIFVGACKHKHEIGRILTVCKLPRNHTFKKYEIYESFVWE